MLVKDKKIFFKLIIVFIFVLIIIVNHCSNNYRANYKNGKVIEGILFEQESYMYDPSKEYNYYDIVVTNISGELYELDGFKIIVKDKDGKEVNSHIANVKCSFEDKDSFKYTFSIKDKFLTTDKYDLEYKLINKV